MRYDDAAAAAFQAAREIADEGLAAWREAVARYLPPGAAPRLLDLGSGTGFWARAFTDWYGIEVVAVEPSAAMRARSSFAPVLPGDAAHVPLPDASVDAAWLSTVVHHVPDLARAGRELRRVLRPGGRVLIRSVFRGRHREISLFRFFPAAVRALDGYPSVADVEAAFAPCGFGTLALEPVAQTSFPSVRAAAAAMRREAHTPLRLISDAEYADGLSRLRRAAAADDAGTPVVDTLDLLVLG